MKLTRLIYKSRLASQLELTELLDLAKRADDNNAKMSISGILLLSRGTFLQVLEGPSINVNRLYAKIAQDPRHNDIELLSVTDTDDRHFGKWNMKGVALETLPGDESEVLSRKYGQVNGELVIPNDAQLAFSMLFDIFHRRARAALAKE